MTQRELAEKLSITDKAVSKWEQDIPDGTVNAMIEISKLEKNLIVKKMKEYFSLTICLCAAVLFDKLFLAAYGYHWERFNFQFWIEGVIFALSVTLITNGIYFFRYFKDKIK